MVPLLYRVRALAWIPLQVRCRRFERFAIADSAVFVESKRYGVKRSTIADEAHSVVFLS